MPMPPERAWPIRATTPLRLPTKRDDQWSLCGSEDGCLMRPLPNRGFTAQVLRSSFSRKRPRPGRRQVDERIRETETTCCPDRAQRCKLGAVGRAAFGLLVQLAAKAAGQDGKGPIPRRRVTHG